ncbi:hypothetical protein ATKI12_3012 [Kitasatospora sp. Ki12]
MRHELSNIRWGLCSCQPPPVRDHIADRAGTEGARVVTPCRFGPVPTTPRGGGLSETVQVAQWITA